MKKLMKAWLVLSLTSAIAVTSALGQTNRWTWSLDENGNADLTDPTGFPLGPFPGLGFLRPDPLSGITTLFYPLGGFLGVPITPGDVLLFEPAGGTNVLSDILRFDQNGDVWFFSEREPGEPLPDLADVPFFPTPRPGYVSLLEIGPEGNNGRFYAPLPTQPGGDISGVMPEGIAYNFISDVVPEPGSLSLAALGGAALLLLRQRRQARRH